MESNNNELSKLRILVKITADSKTKPEDIKALINLVEQQHKRKKKK